MEDVRREEALLQTVSSAGDLNGNGFDDVIVGARFATSAGGAYREEKSIRQAIGQLQELYQAGSLGPS
jgi:hypothetical protein